MKSMAEEGTSKPIGSGVFGDCTLLRYKKKKYVLKRLSGKNVLKYMEREISGLKRCRGKGVLRLHGVCVETGDIVTNYAGKALDKCVGEEGLKVHKAIIILKQVVSAVQGIVKRNYCHNDIKANNVCLKRPTSVYPKVTLIDLGLSTAIGEAPYKSISQKRAENFPWLAPEMHQGKPCSEASEVFSIGFMAHDLISPQHHYPC